MPVKELKQIAGFSTADLLERANKRCEELELRVNQLQMALNFAVQDLRAEMMTCPITLKEHIAQYERQAK